MAFGIVSLVADKGGVGKTTISHCVAAAVREFDRDGHGVCVMTDNRMLLNSDGNRWYDVVDGRKEADVREWVGRARAMEGNGILVIDGAGGNPEADSWYASISDLVLIPMTPDEESVRCASLDAARLPGSFILPNRWTTNAKAAEVDQDYIAMIQHFVGADRVMPPLPSVHSVAEFVRSDFTGEILPAARSFCRLLTGAVISKLQDKGVWK